METTEFVHRLYQLKPDWDWWLRLHVEFNTNAWRLDYKDGQGERHSITFHDLDYKKVSPEAIIQLVS